MLTVDIEVFPGLLLLHSFNWCMDPSHSHLNYCTCQLVIMTVTLLCQATNSV